MIKFLKRALKSIRDYLHEANKDYIMIINYDSSTNEIECLGWTSQRISSFSGKLTSELWEEIKPWCKLNTNYNNRPCTTIYIWAGMERKHLSYGEPIDNYLNDINLLQTGQGFHYGSGKKYGESEKKICPTCHQEIR